MNYTYIMYISLTVIFLTPMPCVEEAVLRFVSLRCGPDPTYHFDADPDPDFYLMRIRI